MDDRSPLAPRRIHLQRLMAIWRSAGWPCRDAIELDLLAGGWAQLMPDGVGGETVRVTERGVRLLAEARQRRSRAVSAHDRLAGRVCAQLVLQGRIVWRELSLRAKVDLSCAASVGAAHALDLSPRGSAAAAGDCVAAAESSETFASSASPSSWRLARPDVFSLRNTSVESYLQPMVHEVKVSRADLLCELRNDAKRAAYEWLSCETYYVFPAAIAQPEEIPQRFGIWLLHGAIENGELEMLRPARHAPCTLPFAVWMALAKATPVQVEGEAPQAELGEAAPPAAM